MAKNLSEKLEKNKDVDSIHELFESFIFDGLALEITERIKEKYQRAKQAVKNLFGYFIYK